MIDCIRPVTPTSLDDLVVSIEGRRFVRDRNLYALPIPNEAQGFKFHQAFTIANGGKMFSGPVEVLLQVDPSRPTEKTVLDLG